MTIWYEDAIDVDVINERSRGSAVEHLGIVITGATDDSLLGSMTVDQRTVQPFGVVHGGASVLFAETLASWAATYTLDQSRQYAVGLEINANHVRPGLPGLLHGVATPINLGRTTQVWDIRITNEAGKLVCVSRCTMAVLDVPDPSQGPVD
ncbi:hotdog fold thioesterase [Raineyella fluvialis]|uniref:Hotdog fold thioesterase n=1 Tax=Raineyella fluvialis TaxID=2662261 RepID=A0A5Q2FBI8_9ACTN|nr:hotdog fold thioesterase [Raineyella fluvialis]QGF22403.1 hotdog fold thioesterase [Raineyella fluvialis]